MVGKAMAQEIIQDAIHVAKTPSAMPSARKVATPDTRKVMMREVPSGRAKRRDAAGSLFTAATTICYGLSMANALPFQAAKELTQAVRKKKIGCLELLELYLKRVERYNPKLNAIIATDLDKARLRARAA